jgi:zinc and cadmium transporter
MTSYPLLLLIIIFTLIGGILSVMAAGIFLLLPDDKRQHILPHGISFAIGALLSVAFCDLIPEAFEHAKEGQVQVLSSTILIGILVFFILEKLLIWRHCHHGECEAHGEEGHEHPANIHPLDRAKTAGIFIILGDSIHNFVDGILIAAAFLTDVQLGIMTSLAVVTHEIPQEVGDFAILLHSGYSKRQALFYNVLSSLTTVIGGVLAYFSLEDLHDMLPYFLALAASSFIYIAVADLIPSLHKRSDINASIQQISLIILGVLLISTLNNLAHHG